MPEVREFDEILEEVQTGYDKVGVLLGNGFSIDYDREIFDYNSLSEEAHLPSLSVPKDDLFASLGTKNFELVIERLRYAAALEELYGDVGGRAALLLADAMVVRNGLADVIAARHPGGPGVLDYDEIRHARTFLSNFDNIFTLSYDLLLYWVINQEDATPEVRREDGFEWPTFRDRSGHVWKKSPSRPQHVFFLHGALHLFVADRRLWKLTFADHGRLIDELRARLAAGQYPLIVTEGSRDEKEARIDKSAYLRFGLRRLGALEGALFIHGMSMSSNDDHVLEQLEADTSGVTMLCIGVHGNPRSSAARKLMERAEHVQERRRSNGGRALELRFYDSDSAHVWR